MGSTRKETFHMLKKKKIKFPKVCAYKNQLWKGQMFHNNELSSCFLIAKTPLGRNRIIIAAPKVRVDCSLGCLRMVCGKFSQGSGGVSCFCQKWPQAWLSQNEPWSLRSLTERCSPDPCVSLTPHPTQHLRLCLFCFTLLFLWKYWRFCTSTASVANISSDLHIQMKLSGRT